MSNSTPLDKSLLRQLERQISQCMLRDQYRLRRALSKGLKGKNVSALEKLQQQIQQSTQLRQNRAAALPRIHYAEDLPVSQRVADIAAAIRDHQVVIVAGETGSGKTTQLPKICLELGRGVAGFIGHTQPRRIAARSIAARLAEELGSNVGGAVGYKVRFNDQLGELTQVKLMTDGILLAESQHDRFLQQYDTLIIDEAHERSLNIDFLLGYLKRILPKRPDLKIIITSATIDTERFAKFFHEAPVIEVSGRSYPVDVWYRPLQDDDSKKSRELSQAVLDAVDELAQYDLSSGALPGNVLVFFSSERDIRDTAEALRKHHPPQTEILPLYARLSATEQQKVFQLSGKRRIVLATNVAETSLTVPGIRYVVDSGTARLSRYSYRSKVQRLPVEPVSQSSANQRKGRCGRLSEGVCIRLYSEEDFLQRPEFTDPEIQRTNLAAVILQMEALQLGHIEDFPFIDPPDHRFIKDGYKLLFELGAVDEHQHITALGRELAQLPVDPKLARMLLAARQQHCLAEMLVIVSALSVQDPRERPADKQQQADEKHNLFKHGPDADEQSGKSKAKSDFLFYLHLWQHFQQHLKHDSRNQLRKFCRQHFLSYMRMLEWRDIYQQLFTHFREKGAALNQQAATYDQLHQAMLTGLLGNLGNLDVGDKEYLGPRGIKFLIHPSSWLHHQKPKWIACAEVVETTRVYGRVVAAVQPQWIEAVAGHLLKRSYTQPHWQKKTATVAAYEKVSLYGLTLVAQRLVNYGPIDGKTSREIFIREGLVGGAYHSYADFFRHNEQLLEEVEVLEAKSRRRDILADEQTLFEFYDERIPAHVCSGASFEKWLKKITPQHPELLHLDKATLMQHRGEGITEAQFPDSMAINGVELALSYHFQPGQEDDGVSVHLPLLMLGQLQSQEFDFLVPGLLRDKLIAILKALPKVYRRALVPVPDYVDGFLASALMRKDRPLFDSLAAYLRAHSGLDIAPLVWQQIVLDDFYRMRFVVFTEDNAALGSGRDLAALQKQFSGQAKQFIAKAPSNEWERSGVRRWDFGDLPESISVTQQGLKISSYPAIVDEKDSVALQLHTDPQQAAQLSLNGVLRLCKLALAQELKYLRKNYLHLQQLTMMYASLGSREQLLDDLENALLLRLMQQQPQLPRRQRVFEQLIEQSKPQLVNMANTLCENLLQILQSHHNVAKQLQGNVSLQWFDAINDIKQQLSFLIFKHFISKLPAQALLQMPRYLQALEVRLQKLQQSPGNDRQRMGQIQSHWQRVYERLQQTPLQDLSEDWQQYRWMVEEMRVSLFAQELKTAYPVSEKKLQTLYQQIKRQM